MRNRTTIALLAGALALLGLSAFAFDLPDSGSKNFTPPSDTPNHFNNEDEPVSARTADATAKDWSAVDALAAGRPARHPAHWWRHRTGTPKTTRDAKSGARPARTLLKTRRTQPPKARRERQSPM